MNMRECRPMDSCVGCRKIQLYFYCVLARGRRTRANLSTIININRPDGATCSQTVYVRKLFAARARFLQLLVGS